MRGKILIIDDDPDFHHLMRTVLGKAGYSVVSAMDAIQGPMMARRNAPDLILLDICMPAGGGVSVFRRLRQLATTVHIPVLICSGKSKEEIEKDLPEASGQTILPKPAMPDALLAAVRELLGE